MATIFQERFTRNPLEVFAEASGLGEDMLEPDTESMERREDMQRLALGQDEATPNGGAPMTAPAPKIQIGPLFGIMAALLLLGLLVAGGERSPTPVSGRRFR
jgi:hypothetical protein